MFTATQEGQNARWFIEAAILNYGAIQMNAQPAAPSFKAMKDSLVKRKEWGKAKDKETERETTVDNRSRSDDWS